MNPDMTQPEPHSSTTVKSRARELGFDLVGVCEAIPAPHLDAYRDWLGRGFHGTMDYLVRHLPLKESPQHLLPGVRSIIAVGLNYNESNPVQPGQPRIASYALGRDYHKVLRNKLKKLALFLEKEYPGTSCRACVDSAPIFERDYANLAGLGWFGKNTCLIDSKRGSWFFIGLLLTTLKLEADEPAVGGCGSCHRCVDACPTGAIIFEGGRWQIDARACISYLTIEHHGEISPELAAKIGDWTFGCDICQSVCPFNVPRPSQPLRAIPTTEPELLKSREWPSLAELAQISEAKWDPLSAGTAIRRTGIEGIRRNAKFNLKNAD